MSFGIKLNLGNVKKTPKKIKITEGNLTINPFENKLMLLEKVALIAMEKNDIDVDGWFSYIENLIDDSSCYYQEERKESNAWNQISENNYIEDIEQICIQSENAWAIEHIKQIFSNYFNLSKFYSFNNNINDFLILNHVNISEINFYLKIIKHQIFNYESHLNYETKKFVIAGGFSSGKSTFINSILANKKLLPTDIKQTSTIPTYIYLSNSNEKEVILGQNHNNAFIELGQELLSQLKHGTEANDMIASVLQRIVINIKHENINNVLLVDTPGHNNSHHKNNFNNQTDGDIAEKELETTDVLLYFADIERGTVTTSDLDFLKKTDKPFYFIINKSGKKSQAEITDIYYNVLKTLKNFSNLIEVIAYDSIDQKIFKSLKTGNILEIFSPPINFNKDKNVINKIKELEDKHDLRVNKVTILDECIYSINQIFENIIEQINAQIIKIQELYVEFSKNGCYENARETLHKINYLKAIIIAIESCQNSSVYKLLHTVNLINQKIFNINQSSDTIYKKTDKNIFQTIENNNLLEFYDCFLGSGVDILKCNSLNYSPMTYAAKYGNYEMVKFFVDKNIDLNLRDNRGYNILHTAIESNHREIVTLLLNKEPDLIHTKTVNNETASQILNKNTFNSWFKNKYTNEQ